MKHLLLLLTLTGLTLNANTIIVAKDYGDKVCKVGKYINSIDKGNTIVYLAFNGEVRTIKDNWLIMDLKNFNKIPTKYRRCK